MPSSEALFSGVIFTYEGKVSIRRVEPKIVLEEGGRLLNVKVAGATDGMRATCAIGRTFVEAEQVRNGVAECMSPAGLVGNYSVDASVNGHDFTSGSGVWLTLIPTMNVTTVSPGLTSMVGDRLITLTGNFNVANSIYCAVGGSTTEGSAWAFALASVNSATSASCFLPARGEGLHSVEVATLADGEVTHGGQQISYVNGGDVVSVEPSVGSFKGGTLVTVSGSGFIEGQTACTFDGIAAPAIVMSESEALCTTPQGYLGPSTVGISTRWNSVSTRVAPTSLSTVDFKYEKVGTVKSITPARGSIYGGTMLTFVASALTDTTQMYCHFDNRVLVKASMSETGRAECMMIASKLGNHSVGVSYNMVDVFSNQTLFEATKVSNVSFAFPTVVLRVVHELC